MGLAWSEQRRRGGRIAVLGGRRQALGPAGPRTRRLSPRAGCCGRLGSPRAAACLTRCGLGGPRARHVTGFCPRRGILLARAPAPAAPSPAEVLAAPPAVLENAILQAFVQVHSFVHSVILRSLFLSTFSAATFSQGCSETSQPQPCGASRGSADT